ncbi:MAG: Holliday junction branch migration protein RuvA [Lentisphaerae bacterium]|nr:Holliday junction branch migration protein RuvA [Lentisphaerota bacterium]
MIARLTGILAESSFTSCVVDCGGVGYEVQIPVSTFDKLPQPGEQVVLKIHTAVREDAITLFGFATEEERKLFRLLIEVSGIGGKLALNVLSSTAVTTFCAAVAASDVKALSRINGIGKRTAERIIVELRDKLNSGLGGDMAIAAAVSSPENASAINDVSLALEQLGFKRDAIDKVLKNLAAELPEGEIDGEKLLRNAIRKLSF